MLRIMRLPGTLALAAVAASLLAPAAARATDATIDFEALPDGTVVTTQFLDLGGPQQGVEIQRKFDGSPDNDRVRVQTPGPGQAHSGVKVGMGEIYTGEFRTPEAYGRFPFLKRFVRVFASLPLANQTLRLRAIDGGGNVVATDSKPSLGRLGWVQLEVQSPSREIKGFVVEAPGSSWIRIDDLSFDVPDPGVQPPPPAPDFDVTWTNPGFGPTLGLSKGKGTTTTIGIVRSNGSNGDIAFTVDSGTLPKGVTASFSPNPVGGTGSSVKLTLAAKTDAATVDGEAIRVRATPTPSAGATQRTLLIPLTVRLSDYDVFLTGIEVTQGIQRHESPERYYDMTKLVIGSQNEILPGHPLEAGSCGVPNVPSLPVRNYTSLDQPVAYSGVPLARGKQTMARVFARVIAPAGGTADGVSAQLLGFRNGQPLPGGPLSPVNGAIDVHYPTATSGNLWVNCRDRADAAGSLNFVLPEDWTRGTVDLVARLVPDQVDFGPGGECGAPSCAADNSLRMNGVVFAPTSYVTVTPVLLKYGTPAVRPPRPGDVFEDARFLTPSRLLFGKTASADAYAAELSITEEVSDSDLSTKERCSAILDKLEDWAHENPRGDVTVGVYRNVCPGVTVGDEELLATGQGFSVAEANRPRTSVAHEMFHAYGRNHASWNCGGGTGGQVGDLWPPDQKGHIQGVGFDFRGSAPTAMVPGATLPAGGAGGVSGLLPRYYDFMSYCFEGEGSTWNSVRGWNETLAELLAFQVLRGRSKLFGAAGPRLRVRGYTRGAGVVITSVKPAAGEPLKPDPASPYRLVARDAGGRVVAELGMRASPVEGADTVLVRADVPASAASVDIVRDGAVLARRARSARAPTVDVRAPRVGRRNLTVRWRARDADGDRLAARIDYSRDGGRSWRTVFDGPSTGRATLPGSLFAASGRARVRVRVSDGFNEAAGRSRAFRAVGRPPSVRILSPGRGHRTMSDARPYLEGEAYDDAGNRLSGRRLQWFAGRTRLGSGSTPSVAGLPAGTRRIRLVATDGRGRRASAAVRVRVAAATPQFLRLDAPASLPAGARRLTLTVASSVRATLQVGGRRVAVGRAARRVTVRVPAGRALLSVPLRLVAGGKAKRLRLAIPRA